MKKLYVKLQQVLRYRMKGTVDVLEVAITSIEITATPVAWKKDDEGNDVPTAWRVKMFVNKWLELYIHEATDWHEFTFEVI